MKKVILLSMFVLISLFLFGQGHNNNWHFGDSAGITFNTVPPTALTNSSLSTLEGCASISNSNGNIMFYTDGKTIYNRQNLIMLNGLGLHGDSSTTQCTIIVPLPDNNNNTFYIFTLDREAEPKGICYSIVDMALDGGLGGVTTKNQQIMTQGTEKACVIKHSNNTDYWILFHECNSKNFKAFLLTNTGLNPNPIISSIGSYITTTGYVLDVIGHMKVNREGNKIALAILGQNKIELYDFDNSTGTLSNLIGFFEEMPYGIEFSPNSRYLYSTTLYPYNINQYDISINNDTSILNSKINILNPNYSPGTLQIGPDNKIYHSAYYMQYLAAINYPNNQGLACNYVENAIYLGGKLTQGGLPALVYPRIYEEEEEEEETPLTSIIHFPNVFTPNNDGYNDNFYPQFENIEKYEIVIYNKWGTRVFSTNDIEQAWDGKYKGNECSAGVYYWVATFSSYKDNVLVEDHLKGTVDIVRE